MNDETNHLLTVFLRALVLELGEQRLLQHTVNAAHILENKLCAVRLIGGKRESNDGGEMSAPFQAESRATRQETELPVNTA